MVSTNTDLKDFCAIYDYTGKADLSKGCWNSKRILRGNHAFLQLVLSNNNSKKR